jgi:O-succinylbenzoate synthase
MRIRFQFRRYRQPFRAAVRTAHGLWAEREGLWVRVETVADGAGGVGYGEAAPIPWFGTETVAAAEAAARELGEWVEGDLSARVPAGCVCLRHALATALAEANGEATRNGEANVATLGVAALLPAGRAAVGLIAPRAELGYRVFKWKVGVGDLADELALLDDVCAALPNGGRLRLDANGAWDRRQAERWLERCAERPVEFVEQPCFAGAGASAREVRKCEDVLLGLAGDFPTPLALDESLVGEADLERWLGAGWPGVFVVKPSLLPAPEVVLSRLAAAKADVVFSSALETAVGVRSALEAAFRWANAPARPGVTPRALGFGVWPLFADPRWDGGAAVPYVRRDDVRRIDAEALWNAAS